MAAMLDIFDQEKVWDIALKAERRDPLMPYQNAYAGSGCHPDSHGTNEPVTG